MVTNPPKNEVVISLNKDFYNKEAINEAIEDYKEACSAKIETKEEHIITLIPKEEIDLQLLSNEFCNYVLSLMKNKCLV